MATSTSFLFRSGNGKSMKRSLPELNFHPDKELTPTEFGLNVPESQWLRLVYMLFLMSSTGFSIRREITALASDPMGCAPDSNTLRRLCEILTSANLIETKNVPLIRSSTVNLIRLTESGKLVCRRFGWDIKESEWDRLSRLRSAEFHLRYLTLTLEFCFQTRCRNDRVIEVAPENFGGRENDLPDLLVSYRRGILPVYIMGNINPKRKIFESILTNDDDLFGMVAINQSWRSIQSQRAISYRKKGVAADLENLVRNLKTGDAGPLWLNEFI
jgi:hypothetical protein